MASWEQCENAKVSTGERCGELVMTLNISDVDHMGRQRLNICQACAASTAAFIAGVDAAFRTANAWNVDYAEEFDLRQAATRARVRELNVAGDLRRARTAR